MEIRKQPSLELAERTLPAPLLRALRHIFGLGAPGCMLVGGTALAGFYAGHRRSDDLDLFTNAPESQEATVLLLRSLERIGAVIEVRHHSASYCRALCALEGHRFTADVALNPGVFSQGRCTVLAGGIAVADFDTLLMMKAAALVSRCAEKDLYDLYWILCQHEGLTLVAMLESARRLDAGADPEGLLISLTGARLSEDSCDFSLEPAITKAEVFKTISAFKGELARGLRTLAQEEPVPPVGELIAKVRRLSGV